MSNTVKWSKIHPGHANLSDIVGIRVRDIKHGYEWTVWIGPLGRRVLQSAGTTLSKSGAYRAAIREGRKIANFYKDLSK